MASVNDIKVTVTADLIGFDSLADKLRTLRAEAPRQLPSLRACAAGVAGALAMSPRKFSRRSLLGLFR